MLILNFLKSWIFFYPNWLPPFKCTLLLNTFRCENWTVALSNYTHACPILHHANRYFWMLNIQIVKKIVNFDCGRTYLLSHSGFEVTNAVVDLNTTNTPMAARAAPCWLNWPLTWQSKICHICQLIKSIVCSSSLKRIYRLNIYRISAILFQKCVFKVVVQEQRTNMFKNKIDKKCNFKRKHKIQRFSKNHSSPTENNTAIKYL